GRGADVARGAGARPARLRRGPPQLHPQSAAAHAGSRHARGLGYRARRRLAGALTRFRRDRGTENVAVSRCKLSRPDGKGAERKRYLPLDRKSTRLNSSHVKISYAVLCLKK